MLIPILIVWGSGLLLASSLYGALGLMSWYETNRRIARYFQSRRRPQIKRRPLPVVPPPRNGHRKRDVLVGLPGGAVYPRKVERQ